jgi:hypothetical protein
MTLMMISNIVEGKDVMSMKLIKTSQLTRKPSTTDSFPCLKKIPL